MANEPVLVDDLPLLIDDGAGNLVPALAEDACDCCEDTIDLVCCENSPVGMRFYVEVDGIVANDDALLGNCADCGDLNQTYITDALTAGGACSVCTELGAVSFPCYSTSTVYAAVSGKITYSSSGGNWYYKLAAGVHWSTSSTVCGNCALTVYGETADQLIGPVVEGETVPCQHPTSEFTVDNTIGDAFGRMAGIIAPDGLSCAGFTLTSCSAIPGLGHTAAAATLAITLKA